jgi:MULE transposase domain
VGNDNELMNLLFCHPASLEMARTYNCVLLMDCTYKVNRYNMPVLNVVGISHLRKTFFICFVFMGEETEGHYRWALNTIARVIYLGEPPKVVITDRDLALMKAIQIELPDCKHMLCTWHIEKNVVAKCSKIMARQNQDMAPFLAQWNKVIFSTTFDGYNMELDTMETMFGTGHPALKYVKETWLLHKEKFVACHVNEYMHLGNHASSRVEGANATLKFYIRSSQCDLITFIMRAIVAVNHQQLEQMTSENYNKCTRLHVCEDPAMEELAEKIPHVALSMIYNSLCIARAANEKGEVLPSCTRTRRCTMGLPCSHELHKLNGPIPLHLVHPFWYFQGGESKARYLDPRLPITVREVEQSRLPVAHQYPIAAPNPISAKGRPKKGKTKGIKRNPSEFELIGTKNRCSIC